MTNNQSDELLQAVLGELGQLRRLLDERLPQQAKMADASSQNGATQVVTGEARHTPGGHALGEGSPAQPVRKTTPTKRR